MVGRSRTRLCCCCCCCSTGTGVRWGSSICHSVRMRAGLSLSADLFTSHFSLFSLFSVSLCLCTHLPTAMTAAAALSVFLSPAKRHARRRGTGEGDDDDDFFFDHESRCSVPNLSCCRHHSPCSRSSQRKTERDSRRPATRVNRVQWKIERHGHFQPSCLSHSLLPLPAPDARRVCRCASHGASAAAVLAV